MYQKIKCAGFPCFFVEYGKENKKTILFLHGYSDSAKMFEPLKEYLEKDYRVIIPDLPMVRRKNIIYDLHKLSSFVNEFVNNIGLSKFTLCGFSFGGLVAADYAYWYPKKVKSLYMLNSVPRFLAPEMIYKLLVRVEPHKLPRFIYPFAAFLKTGKIGRKILIEAEWFEKSIENITKKPFAVFGTLYEVMWHNIVGGSWRERVRKFNKMPMPKAVVLFKDDKLVPYKIYATKLRRSGVNVIVFEKGGHAETKEYWENLKTLFEKK